MKITIEIEGAEGDAIHSRIVSHAATQILSDLGEQARGMVKMQIFNLLQQELDPVLKAVVKEAVAKLDIPKLISQILENGGGHAPHRIHSASSYAFSAIERRIEAEKENIIREYVERLRAKLSGG